MRQLRLQPISKLQQWVGWVKPRSAGQEARVPRSAGCARAAGEPNKIITWDLRWALVIVIALCNLLGPAAAYAHESRPAYLEINQISGDSYAVLWKKPARQNRGLALSPRFPVSCRNITGPVTQLAPGAFIERRTLRCPEGLMNQTIMIEGLSNTLTDVLVRIELMDGTTQTNVLKPSNPSMTVQGARPVHEIAGEYLVLGTEHILLGIDHLLFVLGLLLIVRGVGLLIKTITAFTIAHSITLAMAALGFVHIPQAPVEAVIALSILFLATELAKQHEGRVGLTHRYPWLVALSFGLLHGFGFAGALTEIGLPQTDIPMALLMFNVGVEIGQLLFIAVALSVLWLGKRLITTPPRWLQHAPAYGIGSLAAFWFIDRVVGFW